MIVDVAAEDRELLERFYRELYLPAFETQREPLDAWIAALGGDQPYEMHMRIVVEHDRILGGITSTRATCSRRSGPAWRAIAGSC